MMSRLSVKRLFALLVGFVLLPLSAAQADIFKVAQFTFTAGEEAGAYLLSVRMPEATSLADPSAIVWPEGCAITSSDRVAGGGQAHITIEIACTRELTPEDVARVPWEMDGAVLSTSIAGEPATVALQSTGEGVLLPLGRTAVEARPLAQVAGEYLRQGIVHILAGWDHLAFVLCLCLLSRGHTLLLLITTFTVGHSISLALAFFEVVKIPVPPVEAVIALSIAFMAREALVAPAAGEDTVRGRWRNMAVVAAFGLLHGLGFASVLGDLGVVPQERVPGLIFFNIGVEIGQLLFVAVIVGLIALVRMAGQLATMRAAALYGAGALGCFWAFERIAGFAP